LLLNSRFTGSNLAQRQRIFKGTLSFRGEVKPEAHAIRFYSTLKNSTQSIKEICHRLNPDMLLDGSAGRLAESTLVYKSKSFPLVNIFTSWFSMLIHHLGDEQQDCWWPQFRDTVSPH
jgi:hypothetical protein